MGMDVFKYIKTTTVVQKEEDLKAILIYPESVYWWIILQLPSSQ